MAVITAPVDGSAVREVDPISRIEGHLGVKVATSGGVITEANMHGNMWRGFENFLLGRDVNDAITFTQRICGVCPVPHGMTSTYAADAVLGYSQNHITFLDDGTYGVPEKALHIRNLVLASEFLMSSLTHFYHLAAPSYVQGPAIPPWTPWFDNSYYDTALQNPGGTQNAPSRGVYDTWSVNVWSAVIKSYVKALRIRRLTFEAGALFAGRMPMTSCFIAGGVTFSGTEDLTDRCTRFSVIMEEIGRFIIREYVPIALTLGVLYPTFDNAQNAAGGSGIGAGTGNFLAWGAFPQADASGTLGLPGGFWSGGQTGGAVFQATNKATVASNFLAGGANAVPDNLTEDIAQAHYVAYAGDSAAYTGTAYYPGDTSRTQPNRANGYSYIKAPRWAGASCEVGPFARLVVAGYYPIDGSTLASTVNPAGLAGYLAYADATVSGLDPRMVEVDIAVALIRANLATLVYSGGTVTQATIDTLDVPTITAAYTEAGAYIGGTVAGAVLALEGGLSTIDRVRARALESLVLVQLMIGAYDKATDTFGTGWIDALASATGDTFISKPVPVGERQGWGATEAPRGALMHQCTINNGKITKYQCIVPTTWNASPHDTAGNRGAIEQALVGPPATPYSAAGASFVDQSGNTQTTQGGVEALRVAQSFDPCIACAVH